MCTKLWERAVSIKNRKLNISKHQRTILINLRLEIFLLIIKSTIKSRDIKGWFWITTKRNNWGLWITVRAKKKRSKSMKLLFITWHISRWGVLLSVTQKEFSEMGQVIARGTFSGNLYMQSILMKDSVLKCTFLNRLLLLVVRILSVKLKRNQKSNKNIQINNSYKIFTLWIKNKKLILVLVLFAK